jgi:hypothetical protein
VHTALESDVSALFGRKTAAQLAKLQADIERKLAGGAVQDTEYWEGLLQKARLARARAVVAEQHAAAVKEKAAALEAKVRAASGVGLCAAR